MRNKIIGIIIVFIVLLVYFFCENKVDVECIKTQQNCLDESFSWEIIAGVTSVDYFEERNGIVLGIENDFDQYYILVSANPIKKVFYRRFDNIWVWKSGDRIIDIVYDYSTSRNELYFYLIPSKYYFFESGRYGAR